jgi:hypothetical protein
MERHEEAACLAHVCARLETTCAGTSVGDTVTCQAVDNDVAAVSTGSNISIVDVRPAYFSLERSYQFRMHERTVNLVSNILAYELTPLQV